MKRLDVKLAYVDGKGWTWAVLLDGALTYSGDGLVTAGGAFDAAVYAVREYHRDEIDVLPDGRMPWERR